MPGSKRPTARIPGWKRPGLVTADRCGDQMSAQTGIAWSSGKMPTTVLGEPLAITVLPITGAPPNASSQKAWRITATSSASGAGPRDVYRRPCSGAPPSASK
jgi:hypothetical protein